MNKWDNYNILSYDIKNIYYINNEPIDRIMTFFSDDNKIHLENSKFSKSIYNVLSWQENNSFDVINSFWTIFTCGLVIANELLLTEKKINKQYYKFSGDKKSVLLGKSYFTKKWFSRKYLVKKEGTHLKMIVRKLQLEFPKINELARLCHSIINFTPCPDSLFNSAKGMCSEVKDFLPLMIDKIEWCIEKNLDLEYGNQNSICIEKLKEYKDWLIRNKETLFLEEFFSINDGKLVGIALFEGQTLEKPLPTNTAELTACLDNIIYILDKRLKKIYNK